MQSPHNGAPERLRVSEDDGRRNSSGEPTGIPAWVHRLSRPASASPRQETYCLSYDAKCLTRPHSRATPCVVSKPKGSQLSSTQIAFPPDFPGLGSSGGSKPFRSNHSSCRPTPRQQQPSPAWADRHSHAAGAKPPGIKDSERTATAKPVRPSLGPAAAANRPATAPAGEPGQAGATSLRPSQQQHSRGGLPAAWNLEAIRQQLARLQAANCSSRSRPAVSPSKSFRIPAYQGKTDSSTQAEAHQHRSSSVQANDENVPVQKQQIGSQLRQSPRRQERALPCTSPRPIETRPPRRLAKPLLPSRPETPASKPSPAERAASYAGPAAAVTARPPRAPQPPHALEDWPRVVLPSEQAPAGSSLSRHGSDQASKHADAASTSSDEDTCTAGSTRHPSLPRATGSQSMLCTEPANAKRPLPEALGLNPPTAVTLQAPPAASQPASAKGATTQDQQPQNDDAVTPSWSNDLPGYDVGHVIGIGGFCKVRLGTDRASGQQVALKIVEKNQAVQPDQNLKWKVGREIGIVRQLNHPRINKLLGVVDSAERMFIILRHVAGGSLLDKVRAAKRLPEIEAASLVAQAAEGLIHCHTHQCVHRDIKLENLLLDEHGSLQIIDFGLAAVWTPGKLLRMHCGSPSYAAPEIVARRLYEGPPVDVWSLGVVLFAMLCGRLPFAAPKSNKQELCAKILRGAYNVPDYVSLEARDLLSAMLTLDPSHRITLPQLLGHPWIAAMHRQRAPRSVVGARA